MSEPPITPPPFQTLNYASPVTLPAAVARKKAIRHLRGNGIGCILLGTYGGLAGFSNFTDAVTKSPASLILVIAGVITLSYSLAFLASGILQIIACIKLRTPNPFWQKLIAIVSYIHIAAIALWLVALIAVYAKTSNFIILPFAISLLIMISLAQGIQKVHKIEQEERQPS